jgi:oligo-1,6-glucosidase
MNQMEIRQTVLHRTWWKEAVIYQIYPRSFMDGNGDGIGDIKGITSKLDYLKELGVDVLWISPLYKSPNDDNGYDISDYQDIMDEFGTMDDFDEMLAEAHSRGIRIVMDLVVNHTSDEHRWFVESRKNTENPYRDYYIWREPKEDGSAPNNWGSCFGGSAWEYDDKTEMYYLHLFSKKQPDLNWDNENVRREVFDMMTWWCEKGIDGFRMDVISMISKNPELPDGEVSDEGFGNFGPHCVHGPHVHEYLKEMNEKVLSRYDIMTVGETSGVTVEEAQRYAGEDSHELNMVFQFEHVESDGKYGKWTDEKVPLSFLKDNLSKWQTTLYGKAWNSLFWDNHDQPRAVSRFGDDRPEYREVSAKMLATCLHMMQGTPYVYQGEELGMTNYPFQSKEDFRDIESIHAYEDWVESGKVTREEFWPCLLGKSRDNARTPMQWDAGEHAGFTTGTPWIAVNPNYTTINAEAELQDPNSVFHYYKKLIALRKEYPVVVYGKYELLLPEDKQIFAYTRTLENEKLLVVCNFTDEGCRMDIPDEFCEAECLISNYNGRNYSGTVELEAYEAFVLKK